MDLREIPNQLARRHPWEVARARFFTGIAIADANLESGPAWAVLDAGAGDGFVAAGLVSRLPSGSQIVCFDEHYTDADLARFQPDALPGMRFSRDRPARRFDLVLLLDVLEHVEDDVGFLTRLVSENLAAGGRVLISVPAWPSLYTEHDRALLHHRRYTPATCRALIASAGLDVIRDGGLFHALLPVRAVSALREAVGRRIGRTPRVQAHVGHWDGGPLLSAIVERALFADNALSRRLARLGIALPGLSFWALCRAKA
jgi:SAM-dependent methyltransferase